MFRNCQPEGEEPQAYLGNSNCLQKYLFWFHHCCIVIELASWSLFFFLNQTSFSIYLPSYTSLRLGPKRVTPIQGELEVLVIRENRELTRLVNVLTSFTLTIRRPFIRLLQIIVTSSSRVRWP